MDRAKSDCSTGRDRSLYPRLGRGCVNARPRRRGMTISVRGNCCDVVENSWAKTDEAQAGARYTAGLAVVAVGGLFAVFATISRKGRRGLEAGAKGYGATDSSVDALLA